MQPLLVPISPFVVNKASQFMHAPTDAHWDAVKRILRYLKGSLSHDLQLHSNSSLELHAYFDVDWMSCPDNRHSISEFCVFFNFNFFS